MVDSTGEEVISRGLELPFADISAHRLRGDGALAYFLTVDLGVGMGSFNGPITRIAEVRKGWLHWLSARHMPGDVVTETGLMTSLKTAWKLVPGRSGRGQDVLLHACRPRFDPDGGSDQSGMDLIYSRYSFEDGEWRLYERREPGFWENEGTFPPRSSFP